jgi:2-oxo-4-hydroxy-4-carboxy--5-ureidoimidazoline (OHCU) decarboxylase
MRDFGFPFIIAVKGLNKDNILDAFESRIENDAAAEFETALRASGDGSPALRIASLLPETGA